MRIMSTCRDCDGLLHVTDGYTFHPLCTPKPTKVEQLAASWLNKILEGDEFSADSLEYDIEHLDNQPPHMLDAALRYASWGWPVFPLKPCSKQPATRHGFKDATTDPHRIRQWWTKHPQSNIGLPTGHMFDVIDIDVPEGVPTLTQLAGEDLSVHGQVCSASGGTHLYITPTGRGNHTRWMPGTDYRGKGGYVVGAPSWLGRRGTSWSWLHQPSPIITGVGDTYGVQ